MSSNANDLFGQSLIVLKYSTIERLGTMLNGRKFLTSPDQKLRDWRGLADYAGLGSEDRQRLETSKDYTRDIVTLWCKNGSCKTTVRNLIECLKAIDRWDVIDDLNDLLVRDCEAARDLVVSNNLNQGEYSRALSIQDIGAVSRGVGLPHYNAIVLFADKDENDLAFSMHVVQRMEAAGLKVFVPQRDLCVGTAEHVASVDLIKERCDKVVAIFSPSFVKSRENLFLANFAQHVAIQDNTNKIIPIIYKECELPRQYMIYHKLSYKKPSTIFNFWDKLLVKTFMVQNLRADLKEYTYPVPGDSTSLSSISTTTTTTKVNGDTDTMCSSVSDMSIKTTSTTISAKSSDVSKLLPNPPTHEPGQDDVKQSAKKEKTKKYKRFFKEKLKIGK